MKSKGEYSIAICARDDRGRLWDEGVTLSIDTRKSGFTDYAEAATIKLNLNEAKELVEKLATCIASVEGTANSANERMGSYEETGEDPDY